MLYLIILTILLSTSICNAGSVVTAIDKEREVTDYIATYANWLNDIERYDDIVKYDIVKIDVKPIVVENYQEVIDWGKELGNAIISVRANHWLNIIMTELKKANPDLVKITQAKTELRIELTKGNIPADKIDRLVGYAEGKIKPVRQSIDWVLWKDAYDITKSIPNGDDVFLLISDLNIGYEKLYDVYFSNHQGKTMAVFSWDIARENYIRQYMFDFLERYENKIYAVIPNYGVFNNIDDKGDYTKWIEPIGQVIAWVKSNTNLPVGLTVCQVRDDSDVRFHEAMKDLQYDFVYLWGLHDFNYDFGIEFGEANRWANGRPIILGGFWGNLTVPIGELPEAILTDISYKLPSFITMRKSEGWMGLHIIGERWNTILSKCKDRGIILTSQ